MTTLEETLEESRPSAFQILAPAAALLFVIGVVASGASDSTVWYVIRGTGIIAFLLLALAVSVGLVITSRVLPAGRPRVDMYEVHTFVSLLALAFTSVHGVTLLLDKFVSFSVVQILVPFTSSYRPFSVALGILSLYIAAAVYGSFWARHYIGYKTWRTLHYASFIAFILADLHGILSGTDTHTWWATGQYAIATLAVAGLTGWRVASGGPGRARSS
jgi:sulfoxide reductase heme-binding subunit YedZ